MIIQQHRRSICGMNHIKMKVLVTLNNVWNAAVAEKRLPEDSDAPDFAVNRRRFLSEYTRAIPRLREAERCIGCGRCMPHCPQRIEIAAEMRRVGDFVERLRNP